MIRALAGVHRTLLEHHKFEVNYKLEPCKTRILGSNYTPAENCYEIASGQK